MPVKPVVIGIALLALAIAIWLIVGGIRRHRWLSLLRIPPIVCCLLIVALLVPTIFGLNGPHPFFNKPAPVSSGAVLFFRVSPNQGSNSSILVAASARTSKTLWQRDLQGILATFTSDGQNVYTTELLPRTASTAETTNIAARNGADGALLWQVSLSNTSVTTTPAFANGVLYLEAIQPTPQKPVQLHAIRATDGKQLWSVPIVLEDAEGLWNMVATADILYIQPNGSTTQALRRADGKLLWTQAVGTGNNAIGGGIAAGPNAVYICADYGAVTALSASSGAVLWTYGSHDFFHSATFAGDTLYVTAQRSASVGEGPETLYALDANTGAARWQFATQSHNAGTLSIGNGSIFVHADDGIHALRLTDGKVLWHSDPHNSWTFAGSVPVLGSVLYVTAIETLPPDTIQLLGPSKGQMYLYALNAADGRAYWGATVGPVITIYPHLVL